MAVPSSSSSSHLRNLRITSLLFALAALAGCRLADEPILHESQNPLKPLALGADRVVLEVYFVQAPAADAETAESVWKDVDEQQVATDLRRRLAQNGVRIGLCGTQLPDAIAKLLADGGATAPQSDPSDPEIDGQPLVSRQLLHLRPGHRGEIRASATPHDELAVLAVEQGELVGQTYRQAQGVLALKCEPGSDGRVTLEITPELHHGQPRMRYSVGDGMIRLDNAAAKKTFDELRTRVPLAPGQIVVLGATDFPPKGLARAYFTSTVSDKPIERLLVIRLAQAELAE